MSGISWFQFKKQSVFIIKVSVGSCVGILMAQRMNLEFASSAGIIALLSMLGTRKESLQMAADRIISFGVSAALAWLVFAHVGNGWVTYGIYTALLMSVCQIFHWRGVMSVNAVIGTHFWSSPVFTGKHIFNELCLVLIGCGVAVVLNLFHLNREQERQIIRDMRDIEKKLQGILEKLSCYLVGDGREQEVWSDIENLERHLKLSLTLAYEYQSNTFASHTDYYHRYIEMRQRQCEILFHLHRDMNKLRNLPKEARLVADYISYVRSFVLERNEPTRQLARLSEVMEGFLRDAVPHTRKEFEGKAALYHIMMDLEDFLLCKKRFMESLGREEKRIYWHNESTASREL